MNNLTPFLAAYGLTEANLTPERKRQLENVLLEAGRSAGGTAVKEVTKILQEEAAKRGIQTGTIGTSANSNAQKEVEDRLKKQQEEEAAQRQKMLILGGIGAVVLAIIGAVVWRVRKR
ncbi:hypothetical protein [Siphonobacter sp.]|uniref:hypothetical protein n=1 Tax=Siphonobacter sp. TaxID=1869184 RepID=UPI003B3A3DFE